MNDLNIETLVQKATYCIPTGYEIYKKSDGNMWVLTYATYQACSPLLELGKALMTRAIKPELKVRQAKPRQLSNDLVWVDKDGNRAELVVRVECLFAEDQGELFSKHMIKDGIDIVVEEALRICRLSKEKAEAGTIHQIGMDKARAGRPDYIHTLINNADLLAMAFIKIACGKHPIARFSLDLGDSRVREFPFSEAQKRTLESNEKILIKFGIVMGVDEDVGLVRILEEGASQKKVLLATFEDTHVAQLRHAQEDYAGTEKNAKAKHKCKFLLIPTREVSAFEDKITGYHLKEFQVLESFLEF